MKKQGSLVLTALVFFAAYLLSGAPAAGQQIEWEEAPQFEVGAGGQVDVTARIFQPANSQPYLILLLEKPKAALLIDIGKKRVAEFSASLLKPAKGNAYGITTTGVPQGKPVGAYAFKDGASSFSYAGRSYTVRIKESLVGEVTEGILLAHSPVYRFRRDAYRPKKSAIRFIAKYDKPTQIVVMFATWCPTCKRVIPPFLKTIQEANNPKISVRYIAIAMGGSEPRKELEQYGHDYPAVIVFRDGKERGRMIGEPTVPVEDYLVMLLKK